MWILVDTNNRVLGQYPSYAEALEAAAVLEYYGLRCDIKKLQKENV